ncbi:hypothetical protein GCM10007862_29730 [Dyella lipolytica]|uniref:Uncharacterized protein n=1 Tax=Dyella lipolytica TaxID=1867835 RepID=A0ABW8IVM3_9GAMM|nr:hypothetical protein [Dyella lipolytica]GLQ47922.1 hypothetical protein GCM10007862_29730 [Dyella lipolytica]
MLAAYGQGVAGRTSQAPLDGQLSIQVNDDRLTLTVAKAPQVYLYGVIDADAPHRVGALIDSRKIPPGSDIYLNSQGGDLAAGIALGRLFRAGSMTTHLGVPRLKHRSPTTPKAAVCVGACAYAYLGGLYRWAPSGNDRIGLNAFVVTDPPANETGKTQPASGDILSYLKDMGINPAPFTPAPTTSPATSHDDIVWLSSDQLLATGLANNGYLMLRATYESSSGVPSLVLSQIVRGGVNKITLQCRPNGQTLTAYYTIGASRARQIVAHGTYPHFEVDQQEVLPRQLETIDAVDDALVISRPYTLAQLEQLLAAHTLGAWVSDTRNALRYGFVVGFGSVIKGTIRTYYTQCAQTSQSLNAQQR